MKMQKKGEHRSRKLRGCQARFFLGEGDDTAGEDLLSKLPEEILCFIVSLLPLRDAARTSILAKKWRHLWRSSSNLKFDLMNMTGNDYSKRKFLLHNNLWYEPYDRGQVKSLQKKERIFVMWVNQILGLHDGGKIESCKIDYPLDLQCSDNLGNWMQTLATKGVEELYVKLSYVNRLSKCYQRHEFPCWVFAQAEGGSHLKHLSLEYCDLKQPCNFSCFNNLMSLSLSHTSLTHDNVENIFQCIKLESFSAYSCYFLDRKLKIAGNCSNLKHLNISFCCTLVNLEICGATSFSSLELRGASIRDFSFKNSAVPVKLHFYHKLIRAVNYAFGQLGRDFTQLHTLCLSLGIDESVKIPKQLPAFSKLKEMVLPMAGVDPKSVLELINTLLNASPLLHVIELHLPWCPDETASKLSKKLDSGELSPHKSLKKVKMFNFRGASLELQVLSYLFKSANCVEHLTINRRGLVYEGDGKWTECQTKPKVTRKQLRVILRGRVPLFTRLTIL